MNSRDFRRSCMVGCGVAMCAASAALAPHVSSITTTEAVTDISQFASVAAALLGAGGAVVALIGLVPLAWKYGKKAYDYLKEKIKEKFHISEKEAENLMQQSKSKDFSKSSSKGNMKDRMADGYKHSMEVRPTKKVSKAVSPLHMYSGPSYSNYGKRSRRGR